MNWGFDYVLKMERGIPHIYMFLTVALLTPKFCCIKIVNSTMLFQNLLRKYWGKKGNDAQTAIKGIESN